LCDARGVKLMIACRELSSWVRETNRTEKLPIQLHVQIVDCLQRNEVSRIVQVMEGGSETSRGTRVLRAQWSKLPELHGPHLSRALAPSSDEY
jgi:hypothetical protein